MQKKIKSAYRITKILLVGQTPPPYGGQAIMQQEARAGKYKNIKFIHAPLAFSKDMDEVGKFKLTKLFHLIYVICNIIFLKFRHKIKILYYPPAGPHKIPVYRDMAILISVRWLFNKTVFHFHAGGVSKLYKKLTVLERFFFKKAYFYPDLSIILSEKNPEDGQFFKTKKNAIIPYGIYDHFPKYKNLKPEKKEPPVLLYVGAIRKSKGVLIFLEALSQLKTEKIPFYAKFMGKFESENFKNKVYAFIQSHNLKDHIEFIGVKKGDDKWDVFYKSDILCFPSFFNSETFGLVALEAMQFELPVVATLWRGIPSVVKDKKSGFLVPVKESCALKEKIKLLLYDEKLRKKMGQCGREIFIEEFTLEKYWNNLENIFRNVDEITSTNRHIDWG